MSTILNTNGADLEIPQPLSKDFSCAIVVAEWNEHITGALLRGAVDVLRQAGVGEENIHVHHVPGSVELVYGSRVVIDTLKPDAVIAIGCVIRGDTPHFDYVCESATQGVTALNVEGKAAVIFGVLTVDTEQQAIDRAGGCLGNKGAEAAVAAIKMANLKVSLAK